MHYVVLDSVVEKHQPSEGNQFSSDVLKGLSADLKALPSKYFYDARGSELFEKITHLDEYYLTRCEHQILNQIGPEIANFFSDDEFELIELGAGDGQKTKVLLTSLLKQASSFSYNPIDISETAMAGLVNSLAYSHPKLTSQGVVGDYFDSIRHMETVSDKRKLVLFLGSSIGNFDFPNAIYFLKAIWKCLNNGDLLLIGFDLKKDINVLLQAYNDSKGITRAFNLNMLNRINIELDGDFDLTKFYHYGFYNPIQGAMESYLVSIEAQQVYIGELETTFDFKAFEAIHMEVSYKYLQDDINKMAAQSGFSVLANWQDERKYFTDSLWQVNKLNKI